MTKNTIRGLCVLALVLAACGGTESGEGVGGSGGSSACPVFASVSVPCDNQAQEAKATFGGISAEQIARCMVAIGTLRAGEPDGATTRQIPIIAGDGLAIASCYENGRIVGLVTFEAAH